MFTDRQISLIKELKIEGFGWRKFAESVESSGRCSQKQEDTMCRMTQQIFYNKRMKSNRFSSYRGCSDISDNEAMRSGDFF